MTTTETTKNFPSPAEIRERLKADAAAEIDDALAAVEAMLLRGKSVAPIEWSYHVRAAVKERLRESGWSVTYGGACGEKCVEVLPLDAGGGR